MASARPQDGDNIAMETLDQKKSGYLALAAIMGPFPRMGMYKRFASLNSYSLLLRQAELIHLEVKLQNLMIVDKDAGLRYHESVYDMLDATRAEGVDAERWHLVLEIRDKLHDNDAALSQQAAIAKLSGPRPYDVSVLQDWLARREGGNNFLGPDEDRPWLEGEESDLIAVGSNSHDSLTNYIEERFVPWASHHGLLRKAPVEGHESVGLVEYQQTTFLAIAKGLGVFISTAIPSISIVTLYLINDMRWRIVATCLLTLLFATALAMTTAARPAEMFVATAAFAAVQVVFVGSTRTAV